MNTREFQYVVTVYDEGSITKAAASLMLSQASLSKYIINLEDSYGYRIFDRSVQPWKLTDFGEAYVRIARKALLLERELEQKRQDLTNYETGTLKIGLPIMLSSFLLPKTLPEFHRQYPNVELLIEEYSSKELEERLLRGSLDFMVSYRDHIHPMLDYHKVAEERFYLVASPGHFSEVPSGTSFEELIRLVDFNQQTLILLNPWQRTRIIANKVLQDYDLSPNIRIFTKQLDVAAKLSINGSGITFVPESLKTSLQGLRGYENADYYPLPDQYNLKADAIVRKDDYTPKLTLEFIDILRKNYNQKG